MGSEFVCKYGKEEEKKKKIERYSLAETGTSL